MPEITGHLAPLVGTFTAAGALWEIEGRPQGTISGDLVLVAGRVAEGRTDLAGTFTAELQHTLPEDASYYVLKSCGRYWPFQYQVRDGTDTVGGNIRAYNLRHPEGIPTIVHVPTPGPQGIPGRPGGPGQEGPEGRVGPEGSTLFQVFKSVLIADAPNEPAPVGGTVDTDTGVVVPPAGWAGPAIPPVGYVLLFSDTTVHHTHTGVVVPIWSSPGEAGSQGRTGPPGGPGPRGYRGYRGWLAEWGLVHDGERRVFQLVSWFGGTGPAPVSHIGEYDGSGGFVVSIADATDVRGQRGREGPAGAGGDDETARTAAAQAQAAADGAIAVNVLQAEAILALQEAPPGVASYNQLADKPIIRMDVPIPSEATQDVLLMDAAGILYNTRGHGATERQVEWGNPDGTPMPVGTNLVAHAGYPATNYRGVRQSDHPQDWLIGYSYYIRQGSYWVRRDATGHGVNYQPPRWRGAWSYRQDADASATGVGDIAAFIFNEMADNRVSVYKVTTFVEGQNADWRLIPVGYIDPGRLVPDPTNYGGRVLEANERNTGTHWAHALQPDDILPHVGRVPAAPVAGDADLIFLTETYSEGLRSDATLTVGFSGALAGFGTASPGPAFGVFDAASPIVRLFGVGTAAGYNIETISSFSKTWMDDIASVWIAGNAYTLGDRFREGVLHSRRIQNYPENLVAATVDVNVRMLDDDFYFTTGIGDVFERGLFALIDDGTGTLLYDPYSSRTLIHSDGVGPPTEPPRHPALSYQNSLGQQWIGGGTYVYHSVDPLGSSDLFVHEKYVPHPATRTEIFDTAGDGGFTRIRHGGTASFSQWQGSGNYVEGLLFREVWNYLAEHVYPSGADHAAAVAYRDHGYFSGGFSHFVEALRNIDIFLAGDAFAANRYFWANDSINQGGLRVLTAFTPGTTSRDDTFFWRGPTAVTADIPAWMDLNSYAYTEAELVAGAGISITPDPADQTLTITATGGGGGGGTLVTSRVQIGTVDLSSNSGAALALDEPIVSGVEYEIVATSATAGVLLHETFLGDELLDRPVTAAVTTSTINAWRTAGVRGVASSTSHATGAYNLWVTDPSNLIINNSRGDTVTIVICKLVRTITVTRNKKPRRRR